MPQEGESSLSQEACKQWSPGIFRGLQKNRLKHWVEARLGYTGSRNHFKHSLEAEELREKGLSRYGAILCDLKAFCKGIPYVQHTSNHYLLPGPEVNSTRGVQVNPGHKCPK